MSRVRISTTVDGEQLAALRARLGAADSVLVDRALRTLNDELDREVELAAIEAHPYEDDGELNWEVASPPGLPYSGPIPPDVVALARRRRSARR